MASLLHKNSPEPRDPEKGSPDSSRILLIIRWSLAAFFFSGILVFFPSVSSVLFLLLTVLTVPIKPLERFFRSKIPFKKKHQNCCNGGSFCRLRSYLAEFGKQPQWRAQGSRRPSRLIPAPRAKSLPIRPPYKRPPRMRPPPKHPTLRRRPAPALTRCQPLTRKTIPPPTLRALPTQSLHPPPSQNPSPSQHLPRSRKFRIRKIIMDMCTQPPAANAIITKNTVLTAKRKTA